jgi:hypothetical protein
LSGGVTVVGQGHRVFIPFWHVLFGHGQCTAQVVSPRYKSQG